MNKEKLLLQLKSYLLDKEFIIACANADIAKFGEWQCDWLEGMRNVDQMVNSVLYEIEKAENGE